MKITFRKIMQEDVSSILEMFRGIKEEGIDMSFAEMETLEEVSDLVDNPS